MLRQVDWLVRQAGAEDYEWTPEAGSKQPCRITLYPGQPFTFAGLWESWSKADQVVGSCTIIVTNSNELTRDIHDRMPDILDPADYDAWLDGSAGVHCCLYRRGGAVLVHEQLG